LLRTWINRRLTRFLNQQVSRYERLYHNDIDLLKRHIRKGDVLLVEGDQRISAIIKHLTHSSWSHAALYVGDELVRRGGALRKLAQEQFGDEADHLLVEALMEGVIVSPLAKYTDKNVRVCRPHRLRTQHLRSILDEAVSSIGWGYDMRNVAELARHMVMAALMPQRYRHDAMQFGSGAATAVMCTSLIGRLFHGVDFPVLPSVTPPTSSGEADEPKRSAWSRLRRRRANYSGVYRRRDPTLLTPRDFDLSPYFDIVKFNVVSQKGFDYGRIEWEESAEEELPEAAPASASSALPIGPSAASSKNGG